MTRSYWQKIVNHKSPPQPCKRAIILLPFYRWRHGRSGSLSSPVREWAGLHKFPDTWRNIRGPLLHHLGCTCANACGPTCTRAEGSGTLSLITQGSHDALRLFRLVWIWWFRATTPVLTGVRRPGATIIAVMCEISVSSLWMKPGVNLLKTKSYTFEINFLCSRGSRTFLVMCMCGGLSSGSRLWTEWWGCVINKIRLQVSQEEKH